MANGQRFVLVLAPRFHHIYGMNGKLSYGFETPAYSYAEVETALARTLVVPAGHQRGALRARLKHLQRLGLVDLKAGKGKRVKYNHAQVAQWLLALIMAEMGLDPTIVVTSLKGSWKHIASAVEEAIGPEAQRGGRPYYLCVWPRVMSGPWRQKPSLAISVEQLPDDELRNKIHSSRDDWFGIYNLTRALSHLDIVLPRRG